MTVIAFRRPSRRITLTIDWDEHGIAHFALEGKRLKLDQFEKLVAALSDMAKEWRQQVLE